MIHYAVSNVLHYRKKYTAAFLLIVFVSACMALTLFLGAGLSDQAYKFARSEGDIYLSISQTCPEREPILDFVSSVLMPEKILPLPSVECQVFTTSFSRRTRLMTKESVALLPGFFIVKGQVMSGSALIPVEWKKDFLARSDFRLSYRDQEGILNSVRLKVSGFYLGSPSFGNSVLISNDDYEDLVGNVAAQSFLLFFDSTKGDIGIISDSSFATMRARLSEAFPEQVKDGSIHLFHNSREMLYASKNMIFFFQLIVFSFIIVLGVIAVLTVVNSIYLTTVHRIPAIATLMSFGMTKRSAVVMLAFETLVFSLFGALVGLAIALVIAGYIPRIDIPIDNFTLLVLLGGRRNISVVPSFAASMSTVALVSLLPFVFAGLSARKMLAGELSLLLASKK